MLLAKVVNNEIIEISEHFEMFPNVSFSVYGVTKDFLEENSLMYATIYKSHNKDVEKLVEVTPYIENGLVYTVVIEPLNDVELAIKKTIKEQEVRGKRNKILIDCDWTQVADAPVDKTAWATYRQALRDITQQTGFPFNVDFPVNP